MDIVRRIKEKPYIEDDRFMRLILFSKIKKDEFYAVHG